MRSEVQSAMTTAERYDGRTQSLHWISAVLVVLAFGIALGFDLAPKGPVRAAVISAHVVVGVLFAWVLLRRLVWRASSGRRLAHEPGILGLIGRLTHWLLYLLLTAIVLTSVGVIGQRGLDLFGLFKIAPFISTDWVANKRLFLFLHENGAWVVMGLAAVHAAAALYHYYVLGDGILQRMLPTPASDAAGDRRTTSDVRG